MIRSATSAAWMPSPPSSSRIANSSPPSRAAVSAARSAFFSRSPTSSRSPSPAAWPSESLIVLKSSMSMNSTAIGLPVALLSLDGVQHAVAEQRAVREVGDRVVERLVLQLLLELLALRDVTGVEDDPLHVRVVQQARAEGLGGQVRAVPMLQAELQERGVALAVADRRQERQHTRLVVLVDQVDEPRALELLGFGAEQARRGRARVADHGGRLDDRHDVGGVLDERREPRLALAEQQVLGERRALERERDLRGERPEAVGDRRPASPRPSRPPSSRGTRRA